MVAARRGRLGAGVGQAAGVVGLADLTLDPIRFLCRPDVMAFEGSESVDA